MKKFKDIYLKRPFIWTGGTFIFIAISIILYYGEETLISTYFLGFGVITFLTWLLIYSPYKFFKFIRDKRPFNEKRNIDSFIVWVISVFLPLIGILLVSMFPVGHPPYVIEKKKAAELNTASIYLAQAEYNSNNGVYYYTSGGCNSNTTQQIINNLPYDKELGKYLDENFYYCISGDSNSNTFKITAKSVSTNCEIHRDEKYNITFNNC